MTIDEEIRDALTDLLGLYGLTRDEMEGWLSCPADGGPDGDGLYPVTAPNGASVLVASPARLRLLALGSVDEASGQGLIDELEARLARSNASADRAERAAASAATLTKTATIALSSWDRPLNDGRAYRVYDLNLRRSLTLIDGVWRDDFGKVFAAPPYLVDALGIAPVIACSMYRQLRAGYAGPFFQVRRTTDGALKDCRTVADALAHAPEAQLRVVGPYDQMDGQLRSFGTDPNTPRDVAFRVRDGFPTAYNGTGERRAVRFLVADAAKFAGTTGAAVMMTIALPDIYPGAPNGGQSLFYVSTANGNQARFLLRLNDQGRIDAGGRRLDSDAAQTSSSRAVFGRTQSVLVNWNLATARLRIAHNGTTYRDRAYQTAGNVSATAPNTKEINFFDGQTFIECACFAAPFSGAQYAIALADQRAAWGNERVVADTATSEWCDPADIRDGILAYGFSTACEGSSGALQFSGEYDVVTGSELNRLALEEPVHQMDDHNETSVRFLDSGARIDAYIGHKRPIEGAPAGTAGRLLIRYSSTGRISDFGAPISLPSTKAGLNYGEWMESPRSLALLTNDDATVTWFPFYSLRKRPGEFKEGRPIVRQAAAPGGGQNQLYCRARTVGSRARMVMMSHATNVRNALRLVEYDVESGDVFASLGAAIGNAYLPGNAEVALMANLPAIYTPPAGKSVRLMDMSMDGTMLAGCQYDNPSDASQGEHFVLLYDGIGDRFSAASWTYFAVGQSGAAAWASSYYMPTIRFANEPHTGIRLYRTRNEGEAGTWYLDRVDSGNGGYDWRTTNLYQSAYELPRCFCPRGATDALAVIALEGIYNDYTSWRLRSRFFGSNR